MRKIIVLDTSVIAYDPHSFKEFKNSDLVIPITVLDELDKLKSFANTAGKNARIFIRLLDTICEKADVNKPIKLDGDIFLRLDAQEREVKVGTDKNYGDNKILASALSFRKVRGKDREVILVSRDINLRIRARTLGIKAEHYEKDRISRLELYTGMQTITNVDDGVVLNETGMLPLQGTKYDLFPHECVNFVDTNNDGVAIGRKIGDRIRVVQNQTVWGLEARNREQAFAINMLLDPKMPLLSLIGKAGTGKAQPLDAKILTPTGWTTMGAIKPGDEVIGDHGKPIKVLGVYPQGKKKIFRIEFSDGSSTESCDEHLWLTKTSLERDQGKQGKVRELSEIRSSLLYGKNAKKNHSIPMVQPVEFDPVNVDIDPYLLGLLLGDGSFKNSISITSADSEIINYCKDVIPSELSLKMKSDGISYSITKRHRSKNPNVILNHIKSMGLFGISSAEKFIPRNYMFNTKAVRLAVLRGLLDTDGFCSKSGFDTIFYSTSKQLSEDVQFIVQSLGGKAVIKNKFTKFKYKECIKDGKPSFAVYISLPSDIIPFQLTRKKNRFVPRTKYVPKRYITNVSFVGEKDAQCVYVDSVSHLYVTDDFIVTHNTLIAIAAALEMVLERRKYDKVIIYRPIQAVGNDVGFLPGTLEEKMAPWMGAVMDSFELLFGSKSKDKWQLMMQQYMERGRIELQPLTYIRGRSIPNAFIIVDEVQNLTKDDVKTILTRAGYGTKIVLTGDIEQIDAAQLDAINNGLTYVVEKFKKSELAGHVTFTKGERSPLATEASDLL